MITIKPDQQVTTEWRALSACKGYDSDLWFPAGETGLAEDQIAQAKRVCQGCVVADDCLKYAVVTNQRFGIWGGLTEDERRPVRRRWMADRRRARNAIKAGRPPGRTQVRQLGSKSFSIANKS